MFNNFMYNKVKGNALERNSIKIMLNRTGLTLPVLNVDT